MPSGSYNTIKIKKYVDIYKELVANAIIIPGMLIERMSTNKVRKHATASGNASAIFAIEDELQGNGIDDSYAAASVVKCGYFIPGEEVYAILADGENVAIGDLLVSNGAGFLKKYVAVTEDWDSNDGGSITVVPEPVIARALEAKDLSDSSGGEDTSTSVGFNKRIVVEIV